MRKERREIKVRRGPHENAIGLTCITSEVWVPYFLDLAQDRSDRILVPTQSAVYSYSFTKTNLDAPF
jgi:hypothetical protein